MKEEKRTHSIKECSTCEDKEGCTAMVRDEIIAAFDSVTELLGMYKKVAPEVTQSFDFMCNVAADFSMVLAKHIEKAPGLAHKLTGVIVMCSLTPMQLDKLNVLIQAMVIETLRGHEAAVQHVLDNTEYPDDVKATAQEIISKIGNGR